MGHAIEKLALGKGHTVICTVDNPEELAIVTSLAKWADEGSHSASDDFYMESPQIMNEKYMAVFRQLFVKLGHEAHYNMMMGF